MLHGDEQSETEDDRTGEEEQQSCAAGTLGLFAELSYIAGADFPHRVGEFRNRSLV
jgi:hypothetical protein